MPPKVCVLIAVEPHECRADRRISQKALRDSASASRSRASCFHRLTPRRDVTRRDVT